MVSLAKWKRNLKEMIDCSGESDHPDCPRCSATMNFYGHDDNGDFPIGEGYWECPECGFSITEDEL